MPDKAIKAGDRIEKRLVAALTALYMAVYESIQTRFYDLFQKIADVDNGRIKPPYHVRNDPDSVEAWRKRYIRKLMRDEDVARICGEMVASVGLIAVMYIRKAMREIYAENWQYMVDAVEDASIPEITQEFVEKAVSDAEDEFTLIAYDNLSNPEIPEKRFRTELALIAFFGLGAAELKKRLKKVVDRTIYQSVLTSATQRTTVQSTARLQAAQSATGGNVLGFKWNTVGDAKVRDTHAAMRGQIRYGNAPFNSPSGATLQFPGDPKAPAGERIHCRCWIEPV